MNLLSATPADIARFMSYVEIQPNGCWLWIGGRSRGRGNTKWYGSFWFQGMTIRAHRFSCEQIKGVPCLPGHHRDHGCVESLCVSPDCLKVMTKERNQELKLTRKVAA